MTERNKSHTETDTKPRKANKKSRAGVFAKHPVLLPSVIFWLFVWGNFAFPLIYVYFISVPVLVVALVLSFFCFTTRYNFVAVFVWSAPLAIVIFMVFFQLLQLVIPSTQTYYLGMDVATPTGMKTCQSMVRIDRNYLSEGRTPVVPVKRQKIEGEAVFCDLGNGKNLTAVLAFEKRDDTTTLRKLPTLAYRKLKGVGSDSFPQLNERIDLTGDLIPVLVTFDDTADPISMKRVYPDELDDFFGEGYSIESVWVQKTKDEYKNIGIINILPWIRSADKNGRVVYSIPFRKLGLHSAYDPFERTQ